MGVISLLGMVGESIAVANGHLLSSQTRVAGDDPSAPLREAQDPEFSVGVISSTVWVGCYPSWQRAVLSAPGCAAIEHLGPGCGQGSGL